MQKDITFSVWGVRGSFPTTDRRYLRYGGNTSCFSAMTGNQLFVFDAGTGLAELGRNLSAGTMRPDKIHIMISHTHADHIIGLYLFLSQVRDRFELHLYGRTGLAEALADITGPAYWPYSISDSGAVIHTVTPGTDIVTDDGKGAVRISAMAGTHPGGCLWYRLDWFGKSIVYMLDCEVEDNGKASIVRFAKDADILIWDANDIPGREIKGWGHSTWKQGAELGREADVKNVLMAHHGWTHGDNAIQKMETEAELAPSLHENTSGSSPTLCPQGNTGPVSAPAIIFAKEGMVFRI